MIAQVSIYDDGKFLQGRPMYVEPSKVEETEFTTEYIFAFRYSVFKKNAIVELMGRQTNDSAEQEAEMQEHTS